MNIHQRINAAMIAVRSVHQSREHKHNRFKFAGHDDVTAAIRDQFAQLGIVQTVSVVEAERIPVEYKSKDGLKNETWVRLRVRVRWANMDEPQDAIEWESVGEGSQAGPASDLQMGKALSYAVKMGTLKNLMLIGDDTPDNEKDDEQRTPSSLAQEILDAIAAASGKPDELEAFSQNDKFTQGFEQLSEQDKQRVRDAYQKAARG